MKMIAIDPSINCSGQAIFDDGELILVYAIEPKYKGPLIDRVNVMARALSLGSSRLMGEVVLEWPQVYTHGSNDRNDLMGLAGVCGAVAALHPSSIVTAYLPHEWTQNLRKSKSGDPKKSPRGLYIGRRLEGKELDIWKGVKSHDVVDAIGLGLHHLGRMERKRVFPGAT